MPDFRSLRLWDLAHRYAIEVIEALPEHRCRRVPGLRAQIIRSANSIAANLAEGSSRGTPTEFRYFVGVALASLGENEAELLIARDAKILSVSAHSRLAGRIMMLRKLGVSLQRSLEHAAARVSTPAAPSGSGRDT